MSTTLNMVDRLFALAQRHRALGRNHTALSLFQRLAALPNLPAAVAEETQVQLAEMNLDRGRRRQARRHLTAALRHCPDNAYYHHLMAEALEESHPQRAVEHYERSLEVGPDQPEYLCAYGLLALQLGKRQEGLDSLRRAVELAPDDPEMLHCLADGLCHARQADEARSVLRAALFRNPRDVRFRQLWQEFQFDQLRKEQEMGRLGSTGEDEEENSALLPFMRPQVNPVAQRKVMRHDAAGPLPPPHGTGLPVAAPKRQAL